MSLRSLRGVLLLEVLIVVAIAAIVAALTVPTFRYARRSAQSVRTVNNLRQLHLATSLYRTDHGGGGIYGDLQAMGLPHVLDVYYPPRLTNLPESLLVSGCGLHPFSEPHRYTLWYYPGEGGVEFARQAQVFRDRLILFFDIQCSDPSVPIGNRHVSKFGLGILLEGQLARRRGTGEVWDPSWWSDPAL